MCGTDLMQGRNSEKRCVLLVCTAEGLLTMLAEEKTAECFCGVKRTAQGFTRSISVLSIHLTKEKQYIRTKVAAHTV